MTDRADLRVQRPPDTPAPGRAKYTYEELLAAGVRMYSTRDLATLTGRKPQTIRGLLTARNTRVAAGEKPEWDDIPEPVCYVHPNRADRQWDEPRWVADDFEEFEGADGWARRTGKLGLDGKPIPPTRGPASRAGGHGEEVAA